LTLPATAPKASVHHPIEHRLILARRQLRKAVQAIDRADALPKAVHLQLYNIAIDCQGKVELFRGRLPAVATTEPNYPS
jgi:hypothetical protein